MFLTTLLSCFRRFLPALQQNRAQSRLLYLLNRKKSINYNLVSLNFFFFVVGVSMCSDETDRIQISLRELQILYPPTIHSEVYFRIYTTFSVNLCNRSNNACSVKSMLLISNSLQLVLWTIIGWGFCDIHNNQGLGRSYQPKPIPLFFFFSLVRASEWQLQSSIGCYLVNYERILTGSCLLSVYWRTYA